MPFLETLRQSQAEAIACRADPWTLRLERARGKVGDDDIERLATQAVFDLLDVPQKARGAGACRRLAKIMRELGWHAIKARGLTQGGFRDQIRGWAKSTRPRDKRGSTLF
jgi:hypothetical protein